MRPYQVFAEADAILKRYSQGSVTAERTERIREEHTPRSRLMSIRTGVEAQRFRRIVQRYEEHLHRRRIAWDLAPVHTGHGLIFERGGEAERPVRRTRQYILRQEADDVAARQLDAEVPRTAVVELARRDAVHAEADTFRFLRRAVRRAGVDDDDFDVVQLSRVLQRPAQI